MGRRADARGASARPAGRTHRGRSDRQPERAVGDVSRSGERTLPSRRAVSRLWRAHDSRRSARPTARAAWRVRSAGSAVGSLAHGPKPGARAARRGRRRQDRVAGVPGGRGIRMPHRPSGGRGSRDGARIRRRCSSSAPRCWTSWTRCRPPARGAEHRIRPQRRRPAGSVLRRPRGAQPVRRGGAGQPVACAWWTTRSGSTARRRRRWRSSRAACGAESVALVLAIREIGDEQPSCRGCRRSSCGA